MQFYRCNMGKISSYGSSIIYLGFLTSILLSVATVKASVEKLPYCSDNTVGGKSLIFVSTLDGKLSALDVRNGGKLEWSIGTGPGPMLSSSIHRLELTNNGQWVRMIPSLSGGLYKFDGENIEPVPVTADSLLSSSYRYSDDLVIAGGRETRSYGVSKKSGKILYECTILGCSNITLKSEDDELENAGEDVLVLQRITQTVRAVEPRSGTERWNFSVAQHELEMVYPTQCIGNRRSQEIIPLDLEYRVIVPEGLLCAVSRDNPNNVIWKYKFDSPIVSAWREHQQSLQTLNLFSGAGWSWSTNEIPMSPSLYVGMHRKQLYIQESVKLQQLIPKVTRTQELLGIPWKPYPAGTNALAMLGAAEDSQDAAEIGSEGKTTALAVLYGTEYVNGNGFYLFTPQDLSKSNSALCEKVNISIHATSSESNFSEEEEEGEEVTDNIVIVSLWFWWKEVLVISMTSALVLNLLVTRRSNHVPPRISKFDKWNETAYLLPGPGPDERRSTGRSISESISSSSSNVSETSYSSRFLADFEPLACLGKGGFGVVFEAKNKIDDCNYAIKRITLPYRHESRERVMREVRTLAKLEHANIVRYFQAWTESPPAGWQQETDKALAFKEVLSAVSVDIETPSPTFSKPFAMMSNTRTSVKDNIIFNDSVRDEVFDSLISKKGSGQRSHVSQSSRYNDDDSFIIFKSDTQDGSGDKNISSNNNETQSYSHANYSKCTYTNQSNKESILSIGSSLVSSSASNTNQTSVSKKTHKRPMSLDLTSNFKKQQPMPTVYLYIQMQLCQKQSLKEWLLNNRQAERKERVLSIFEQIVDAVEYVHLQGLIHRDLKPSNIFFSLDGQIKIGDFGLVTTMSQSPPDQRVPCDQELKSGVCDKHTQQVGTHLYMSPEQLQGRAYNYKVDIYSLGLILFELLVEFGTEMERITTLKDIRKHEFPQGFSDTFQKEFQLLKLMLSKEPHNRPTTYGIKARPPLNRECSNEEWHFELPPRLSHSSSIDLGS